MARLIGLPCEILLVIATNIQSQRDINALAQTHPTLYPPFNECLYRRNGLEGKSSALIWAAAGIDREGTARQFLTHTRLQMRRNRHTRRRARDGWQRALIQGAKTGNEAVVRQIVENNKKNNARCPVSGKDWERCTALSYAAGLGHVEVVRTLLSRAGPAYLNAENSSRRTAVQLAARSGHLAVVKLLMATRGVKLNGTGPWRTSYSPLLDAVDRQDEEMVKLLLSNDQIDPNEPCGTQRWRPLISAIKGGHAETVEALLDCERVDPNAPIYNTPVRSCLRPLELAAQMGETKIVALLLSRSDIYIRPWTDPESDPLFLAMESRAVGVVELLLSDSRLDHISPNRKGITPIFYAASRDDDALVTLFLAHDHFLLDSLSIAAVYGHTAVVRLILATNRVNPLAPDKQNRTLLSCALSSGHLEIADLLEAAAFRGGWQAEGGSVPQSDVSHLFPPFLCIG